MRVDLVWSVASRVLTAGEKSDTKATYLSVFSRDSRITLSIAKQLAITPTTDHVLSAHALMHSR